MRLDCSKRFAHTLDSNMKMPHSHELFPPSLNLTLEAASDLHGTIDNQVTDRNRRPSNSSREKRNPETGRWEGVRCDQSLIPETINQKQKVLFDNIPYVGIGSLRLAWLCHVAPVG